MRVSIYLIEHLSTLFGCIEIDGLSPIGFSICTTRVPGEYLGKNRARIEGVGPCIDKGGLDREEGCDKQRCKGKRLHAAAIVKCGEYQNVKNRSCMNYRYLSIVAAKVQENVALPVVWSGGDVLKIPSRNGVCVAAVVRG